MKSGTDFIGQGAGESFEDGSSRDLIDMDVLDVRLPCRGYQISYKVAENSDFSLTTEFLLRLLRLTDGMQEDAISEFFAFSGDEMRFVIDHVENAGYARRASGRVYLTDSGHALFVGGDEPRLFEVHAKQDRFDFDLISFSPADPRRFLTRFELELAELPIQGTQDPGQASKAIFQSFSRYFQEFRLKRGGTRFDKQMLYTVDEVQPEHRYPSVLPLTVAVRRDDPAFTETTLVDWRSGPELEDRAAIVQSCANFVRSIRCRSNDLSREATELLVACAPDQLERFYRNGIFDVNALYRTVLRQAGELRIDRPTVRTLGRLWTDANRTRFAAALKYAVARPHSSPPMQVWLRPSVPYWGMTIRLQDLLAAVSRQFQAADADEGIRAITIGEEQASPIFRFGFNAVVNVSPRDLPAGLEVFLVPGLVCYVAVHTPVGRDDGYPISLGILSFDSDVIGRVHQAIAQMLGRAYAVIDYCDWEVTDVVAEIQDALLKLPKSSSSGT